MHAGKRTNRDAAVAGAAVEQSLSADHIPAASRPMIFRERLFKGSLICSLLLSMLVLAILIIDVLHGRLGTAQHRLHHQLPVGLPEERRHPVGDHRNALADA